MPPVPTDVAERAAHVGVKPRARGGHTLMSTKRERLDSLTAKIRGNIDVGASVDPAVVGSLAHMDAEIAANQAAIAVITAIAANSRTESQKAELAMRRQLLALQRVVKVSIRNDIVDSRYGLLLDGGRARPEDISGNE